MFMENSQGGYAVQIGKVFFAYYICIIWTDSSQLAYIVNQYGYTKRTSIEEPMNKIKSENHNSSHQCADAQIRYIQSISIVFYILCLTVRTTSHLYALDSVETQGIWTPSNFFKFQSKKYGSSGTVGMHLTNIQWTLLIFPTELVYRRRNCKASTDAVEIIGSQTFIITEITEKIFMICSCHYSTCWERVIALHSRQNTWPCCGFYTMSFIRNIIVRGHLFLMCFWACILFLKIFALLHFSLSYQTYIFMCHYVSISDKFHGLRYSR